MSRYLGLLRHAKAEQLQPGSGATDADRELAPRGWADARAGGRWLAAHPPGGQHAIQLGPVLDLVLSSTATRTRQTWQGLTEGMVEAMADGTGGRGPAADVWFDRRIYDADAQILLEVLQEVPEEVTRVLLVGHAPGVPALAQLLADPDRSSPGPMAALDRGFPTMGLGSLAVDGPWSALAAGAAALSDLTVHRD